MDVWGSALQLAMNKSLNRIKIAKHFSSENELKLRRCVMCFAVLFGWASLVFEERAVGAEIGLHVYETIGSTILKSNLESLIRLGRRIGPIHLCESPEDQIKKCKEISLAADRALARKQLMDEVNANFGQFGLAQHER